MNSNSISFVVNFHGRKFNDLANKREINGRVAIYWILLVIKLSLSLPHKLASNQIHQLLPGRMSDKEPVVNNVNSLSNKIISSLSRHTLDKGKRKYIIYI